MAHARLEISDLAGRRSLTLDKPVFGVGRRGTNDLTLPHAEVSRDHAEIVTEGDRYTLRDRGSRFGTFVNGERVDQRELKHGDLIRFGQLEGMEVRFCIDTVEPEVTSTSSSAVADLHQVSMLLEGMRALGAGGVLDEVLGLVIDSAIDIGGAERGFIMLADAGGNLEFKLGRGRGRVTLPGRTFQTSRKIPEAVFASGESRVVTDLLDGDLPSSHTGTIALGIRHVFCAPLRLIRYVDDAREAEEQKRIGVLYLDSRSRGRMLSPACRAALDTLAAEAGVAIENARLYREAAEKARLEEELRLAARIQQALLPAPRWECNQFEAVSTTLPCRAIGGDFYDYMLLSSGDSGFAVADVAGKGAAAALLTAVVQGVMSTHATLAVGPAETLSRTNQVMIRRAVESRFVTMVYGVLDCDGRFTYCNAGHNPPFLVTGGAMRRLETGGLPLGMFEHAQYEEETVTLEPGDTLVAFSDGLSEARNQAGDEFGDERIVACMDAHAGGSPSELLDALMAEAKGFSAGALQADDITVMVMRYRG